MRLPRKIPFPAGSFRAVGAGITVPDGKFCRSVWETIPFSWGSITVPVGNEYRTHGELCWQFFLQKDENKKALALRLFMLVH